MKVIKKPDLKIIQCKFCQSVLKIKHRDIQLTEFNQKYVVCPVCYHWNVKDDNELFEGVKNERN